MIISNLLILRVNDYLLNIDVKIVNGDKFKIITQKQLFSNKELKTI